MNYEIKDSFTKIEAEDVVKLETELNIQLPEDYKAFLLEHNGGFILPNSFTYANTAGCMKKPEPGIKQEQKHRIHRLFGILPKGHKSYTGYSIRARRNALFADEKIPDDVVPIGETGNGDVIFIKLSGETTDHVYIWKHGFLVDADDSSDLPACYNSYYIAPDFSTFLSSLS